MTETVAFIRHSLKGIYPPEEAQALVRLIMERVCGISTHQLLLGKGKDLSDTEKSKIKEIVTGLVRFQPIQYLLGVAEFRELDLLVTPDVLIPRPETAELVDRIVVDQQEGAPRILDIGTGSGCIAIALAKALPTAQVEALDISPKALKVAATNARKNDVAIRLYQQDILQANDLPTYDCIVSNPPYIMEKEKESMEANVLEYEPHLALFVPDENPLLFYRAIARFGQEHLSPKGTLYFEINALLGKETCLMLQEERYSQIELMNDFYGKERFIIAKR